MPGRFVSEGTEVNGMQWNPEDETSGLALFQWLTDNDVNYGISGADHYVILMEGHASDPTPSAVVHSRVAPGEWIIRKENGEFSSITTKE